MANFIFRRISPMHTKDMKAKHNCVLNELSHDIYKGYLLYIAPISRAPLIEKS